MRRIARARIATAALAVTLVVAAGCGADEDTPAPGETPREVDRECPDASAGDDERSDIDPQAPALQSTTPQPPGSLRGPGTGNCPGEGEAPDYEVYPDGGTGAGG